MFPIINLRETGINLRRIMDKRGIEPKDVQEYLNLASAQSVYNWCNGINMPTIDNLYALSQLLQVPIDTIVRGNKKATSTYRFEVTNCDLRGIANRKIEVPNWNLKLSK